MLHIVTLYDISFSVLTNKLENCLKKRTQTIITYSQTQCFIPAFIGYVVHRVGIESEYARV